MARFDRQPTTLHNEVSEIDQGVHTSVAALFGTTGQLGVHYVYLYLLCQNVTN